MRTCSVLVLLACFGVLPAAADSAGRITFGQCAEHPKPRKLVRDWKPTPPPSLAESKRTKRAACKKLLASVKTGGRIELIGQLRVAERWRGDLFAADHIEYCRHEDALIARLRRAIERELPAGSVVIERPLTGMPFVALNADEAGLRWLCASALLEGITENIQFTLDTQL
jgi:hypothetical protein